MKAEVVSGIAKIPRVEWNALVAPVSVRVGTHQVVLSSGWMDPTCAPQLEVEAWLAKRFPESSPAAGS